MSVVQYITEDRAVHGVTAAIDLSYLKGILKVARSLFKLPVRPSIVDDAREIPRYMGQLDRSDERDRRPTAEELTALRAWFVEHSKSLIGDIFDFILDSGFRPLGDQAPALGRPEPRAPHHRHPRSERPTQENREQRTVPLLGRCMDIIDRQPHPEGAEFIFDFNGKTWSSTFPHACNELDIKDLRLYDLRHEAISRLVEANDHSIPEIMLISGHKDPKQMMLYTQLRARNLHRGENLSGRLYAITGERLNGKKEKVRA